MSGPGERPTGPSRRFRAVITDLDGVVTRTARLHFVAWKETFDRLLEELPGLTTEQRRPFDAADYRAHVDGKPRLDGVRGFLASRGVELPTGDADDPEDRHTARGVAAGKNRRYLEILRRRGPGIFHDTVEALRRWREAGLRTAVISASRNCREVLQAASLEDLFEARVDGDVARRLGLRGKPAPDVFLEAARRLEVPPEDTVAVEDSIAGVRAARDGGFGLVVGMARRREGTELMEAGAHRVVDSLGEIDLNDERSGARPAARLPRALDRLDEIVERLTSADPAVFLDYDGTLTPIVSRPQDARLSDEMRDRLRRLAAACPVAVVSGRGRKDVEELVGLDAIVYAGSHGFDIAGPEGLRMEHDEARECLPSLDEAEEELRQGLGAVAGAEVERKRFSIAIHYRNVAADDVPTVEDAVDETLARHRDLRRGEGKKVLELQPDVDWHKGRALRWLLHALDLEHAGIVPFYLGDDVTDEDAFRALPEAGVGILVAEADEERSTAADHRLEDPGEVGRFLEAMIELLEDRAVGDDGRERRP